MEDPNWVHAMESKMRNVFSEKKDGREVRGYNEIHSGQNIIPREDAHHHTKDHEAILYWIQGFKDSKCIIGTSPNYKKQIN